MKKVTLLLMLLVASVSFGQLKRVETTKVERIEIGKIQPLGSPLLMEITKSGNSYNFNYKDQKFEILEQYESFTLEETGSDFEELYKMIEEGLKTIPKEDIMLELNNQYVWLNFEKFLGAPVVRFSSSTSKSGSAHISMSNQFTKKQIDKLFGKKK